MGFPSLPTPPDIGSFDLSKTLGLQIPGTANLNSVQSVPIVDRNLTPDLARKIQNPIEDNWNKAIPYYFAVALANTNGVVTSQKLDPSTLAALGLNSNIFTFHIAPSSLSVQNQFAINLAATNGGVLEEHNGLVFRMITISGTTGVLPQKANRQKTPSKALKIAESLFPAATSAITGLLTKATNVAKAVIGGQDNDLGQLKFDLTQTGYYQFWQLNNFLTVYSEGKKKGGIEGNRLRLIFGSGKDGTGYIVTPISFELKKDIANPLLYRYTIVLKAWDLVSAVPLKDEVQADIPTPDAQSIVKAVSGVLTATRSTITGAKNVLAGVFSDIDSYINVYNQALLVYNDAAGLVSDVRTFGNTFNANAQALLLNSDTNRNALVNSLNDPSTRTGTQPPVSAAQASSVTKSANPSAKTVSSLQSAGFDASKPVSKITPNGEDKTDSQKKNITSQANTVVTNALKTDSFLSNTIDTLDIPTEIQAGIDNFRQESQNLTAADIQKLCSTTQTVSNNYSTSIGAMDATFAATYNIPNPTVSNRVPTEDDIITLAALQDSRTQFLSTLATGQFFMQRDSDPFLAANNNLQDNDQLNTPISMFPVAFPRGSTIELLAQRYLGDAARAREIEVLNNLRAPYIDETGFTVPILGANGRTFVVTSNANLAIGQTITIQGTGVTTTRRHILNITNIGGGEFQISVDGLPNLSVFAPLTSPFFQAFLPGTVGPGQTVLIPSNSTPDEFAAIRPTPLFNGLSFAEQVFKVDMALNSITGKDLSVSSAGDVQLSFGYGNAQQALRLAVEVQRGELERHPNFGLPVPVGSRNSDVPIDQAESLLRASITNDSRFIGADVVLTIDGSVVNAEINAQGASGTGQIPVTFEVGKQ